MGKINIQLFNDKSECCGCGACYAACPQSAINMIKDEFGYIYPEINNELCISCGICKRVCLYQNESRRLLTKKTYVASNSNEEELQKSASGGVFYSIAKDFIVNGGVVYGAAMQYVDEKLTVNHIRISDVEDLSILQGSKYVKSNTCEIYDIVKEDLRKNKNVLFSGTPCQVAGLYGYLGSRENSRLYTIDLICHGVPNEQMFQDYIGTIENSNHIKVKDFKFRDKTFSWGLTGSYKYIDDYGVENNKLFSSSESSYYNFFLSGETYRENCYSCKYAGRNREGDLTIGDYWGIEKQHPEYMEENGGAFDTTKGVSCILVNSKNGMDLIESCTKSMILEPSAFDKVSVTNQQLNHPTERGKYRNDILTVYKKEGYKSLESWFPIYLKKKNPPFVKIIKKVIPKCIKDIIRK